MRIALNRGTNVSDGEVARYGLHLLPQKIVVDGVPHDTRGGISNAEVDGWIKTAKVHPYVLGTSAAETIEALQKLAGADRELMVLTVAKHLSQSHASAVSAARTFAKMPGHGAVKVEVIDCNSVDVGAAMVAVFAAEAARAGLPFDRVIRLTNQFAASGQTLIGLRDLSYMVKGGRASFLKVLMANLIDRSPILGLVNHELAQVTTVKRSDLVEGLARTAVERMGPNAKSRRYWLGVNHADDEANAHALANLLKKELDVAFCTIRELNSSIYLHAGSRGIGAYLAPVDGLDWVPPVPPPS